VVNSTALTTEKLMTITMRCNLPFIRTWQLPFLLITNPFSHTHLKDPGMLTHFWWGSVQWDPSRHSSTSEMQDKKPSGGWGWPTVQPHKLNPNSKPITSTITRYVFERSTRPTRSTRCLVRPDWLPRPIVLLAVNTRHAGCYNTGHSLTNMYTVPLLDCATGCGHSDTGTHALHRIGSKIVNNISDAGFQIHAT